MLWRMLRQSWHKNIRYHALAIITLFLAAALISSLLTVAINTGDRMSRELKSYGANILIEPAQQVLPHLSDKYNRVISEQAFLNESALANIKDIFWRNNIIGFAPSLNSEVQVNGRKISVLGTFFNQQVAVPDEEDYRTGHKVISPWWQVQGNWPQEQRPVISGQEVQALIGRQLQQQTGWQPGTQLSLEGVASQLRVKITGVLVSGGEEENQMILPLSAVQALSGLSGKVQAVKVSALIVPENALSRKARKNLDALDAQEYDRWYCTAYVSSIAHQLEEAMSGSVAQPVWQVAASEGVIINKIQLLLIVITLAALIVAGMGIASLTVNRIMARSREIGLMTALGARQSQILMLFYLDAVISGFCGGIVGCMAGWGLAEVAGRMLFSSSLHFSWIVVPCVLILTMMIGIMGTWLPAYRITGLHPVRVLYGR